MALCMGAELTYVERRPGGLGSDKFYKAVLAGTSVHTSYGRRFTTATNYGVKRFSSNLEAAGEMWRVLRSKTGKGYHVVDAAVFEVPDAMLSLEGESPHSGRGVIMPIWDEQQRNERRSQRQAVLNHPDLQGRSPRTPKEGRLLLLELLNPDCSEDVLYGCALADPTERFLVPMGLSHPRCPDFARVANYLAGPKPAASP